MKQKSLALIALPLVTGLVLAGCSAYGNGQDSGTTIQTQTQTQEQSAAAPSATGTSTAAPESSTTTDTGTRMLGTAATGSTSFTEPAPAELVIKDVRVDSHDGFDRVVFEYEGTGTPGFHAGYTEEPRQQASGNPVEVAGQAYIELIIHGTPMGMGDPNSPWVQPGPWALKTGNIEGVSHGAVFEGDTQVFIGLDKQRPYSVTVLENPTRVVVDIENS
ncbi:AMIN-like domain-containing (lipo)protein [Corynebacterium sp. S7]